MSQLFAAFGINAPLLIEQAVNFGILLAALTYLLYKPVMRTIDERRKMVAKGVEDAQEAAQTLARADGEAAKRVGAADGEAGEIVKRARSEASAERAKMLRDAEARAAAVAKDAEARALQTLQSARRESEKEIARLAVLAAEKVLRQKA